MVKAKLKIKLSEKMLSNMVIANKTKINNTEKYITVNKSAVKTQDDFEIEM